MEGNVVVSQKFLTGKFINIFPFQDLISKGPQWKEIYVDMHKQTGHHNIQTETPTTTTTFETITATAGIAEEAKKNLM